MSYLTVIAAILLVDLLALVSPGPNFVLITSTAVSRSRRHALWTATGIATGSLFWASAAALGIVSIFEALPLLGLMLKLIGITYLLYLGVSLLRSKGFTPGTTNTMTSGGGRRGFLRGFLVNLTNPKSAVYYASVFAAFLTPDLPSWVLFLLVASIAAMSLIWHVLIAIGLSAPPVQARYVSVSKHVDRLCGGLLIFLGLRLAWESR